MVKRVEVYTEVGAKRAFAGALDWPGWCRSGRGEDAALEALLACGTRYAAVIRPTGIAFEAPHGPGSFSVVEHLDGDATTEFGAPSIAPAADARPVDMDDLARLRSILEASWAALDRAAAAAHDTVLRPGPRGGGRDLAGIYAHVARAEGSYLRKIGGSPVILDDVDTAAAAALHADVVAAMERAVVEGIPERGPRGGTMWGLRYYVRRAAWHALDHAWEIEDRAMQD